MCVTDPRADAPQQPIVFCTSISPILIPAFERVIAEIKRCNKHASDEMLLQQFVFESIVLMDARIKPRPHIQD